MAIFHNFSMGFRYSFYTCNAGECERVFSSAKKLITAERNALADDTIEACKCLKAWWDQGLIRGQHDV
jgi:hypothetical protein